MKAKCIKQLMTIIDYDYIAINEGEIVNYTTSNKFFIIKENEIEITSMAFFYHFRVIEGDDKMSYSDFEYILCNYVFRSAVLFPEEYDGVRHLIIQNWSRSILITINKEETIIRVSFENGQEIYSTYEEALDGIINHK